MSNDKGLIGLIPSGIDSSEFRKGNQEQGEDENKKDSMTSHSPQLYIKIL